MKILNCEKCKSTDLDEIVENVLYECPACGHLNKDEEQAKINKRRSQTRGMYSVFGDNVLGDKVCR